MDLGAVVVLLPHERRARGTARVGAQGLVDAQVGTCVRRQDIQPAKGRDADI